MTSAVMSLDDQNRSRLVREREGREEEEEDGGKEEGEEGEVGRSLSWLLLRKKRKRFGLGGAEVRRMERGRETMSMIKLRKVKTWQRKWLSEIKEDTMQENP